MVYNILTCRGFEEVGGWIASGPCLSARVGLVLLFFLIAIIRKWGAEEWGVEYHFVFSLIGGIFSYLLMATFTGSFKISFLIGLIIALILGYGAGYFWGGSEENE